MKKYFFIFNSILIIFITTTIYAINRSEGIPGIDPSPMVIDTNIQQNTQDKDTKLDNTKIEDKKINTTTPQQNIESISKEYPDFPRIRNLKVIEDTTYPYSAKIMWEVHPQTTTPIYIVRYSKPISTKEILLNSYNLTSPPLDPQTRVFIDKDIPEGVYYYAAVTAFELSKDGILVLKPDVNYTINPFIVYRDSSKQKNLTKEEQSENFLVDKTKLLPRDFEVQNLNALNINRGVVLNWTPLQIADIKYKIYRSKEPLDSPDRLEKADLIGESFKPNFLDTNPIPNESIFYGVSVYDITNNKEYTDLKFRKSYIAHTYKKPEIEFQYLEYLPDSLIAYQVNKNTIQLFWVDAGPGVKFYKIYRYDQPISNINILNKASFLGNSQSGKIGFLDKNLKPGRYFYAVIPVISNNQELQIFYGNSTFTTYAIHIFGSKSELEKEENVSTTEVEGLQPNIKNIFIKLEDQNNIRITWDYVKENANKIKILIYRSPIQILEYEDLKENAVYIGEFPLVAGVFVDKKLPDGNYYYNFIEYNTETNEINAFYYLKKPVEIKTRTTQISNEENKLTNEKKDETNKKLENESELKIDNKLKKELESKESKKEENKIDVEKETEEIVELILNKREYFTAEKKIQKLFSYESLSSKEKGKIKFYYGILLIRTNRYQEAKKYFLDPDVRNYDFERSRFWYNRLLEKEQ